MQRLHRTLWVLAWALALAGCAVVVPPERAPEVTSAPSGWTCVGSVMAPPDGLREIDAPQLLGPKVVNPPGAGGLCMAKTFQVEQAIVVYRVWDSSYPAGEKGSWWAFALPQGPREAYRLENAICPSWSALNRMVTCRLRPGVTLALGPGQSADCKTDGVLPASRTNQVYLPKAQQGELLPVEDCAASVDWPPTNP